ncbi:MAG TPA: S16 family serine protease [Chloroflexota bacterium]|jgi:PDZ domain-containing protein
MSLPAEVPNDDKPTPRRPSIVTIILGIVLVVVLVIGTLEILPSNYYILLPGDALAVSPMISIAGHPARNRSGNLYMTDVTFIKADHLLEELYGRLNSGADLERSQQFSGGLSQTQYLKLNASLMTDSTHQAEAAALNTVPGYHPTFASTGPRIVFLVPKTPASRVLKAGDVVEYVNGQRVKRAAQVAPLVRKVRPGQSIQLGVLRKNRLIRLTVSTVRSTNGVPDVKGKTALIGIEVQDQLKFPVKIHINAGNIVGPSAGLMFALGIVQRLSPTDITHGCKVAGTGTIDFNGQVGAIGGAKQKIIAANNAGAKYFFVPNVKENLDPAMAHRGNVTVVPVKTLRQALAFLRQLTPCR